jgi:nicotinate-nucleotide adenylyltransferase
MTEPAEKSKPSGLKDPDGPVTLPSVKCGIFGGTFDPIHNGHLQIAAQAERQFNLDRLIFIPAFTPPHKEQDRGGASAPDRLEMLRLALAPFNHWECSDMEIRRAGVSYTIDTLGALREEQPTAEFFLIIGSDNLAALDRWRKPEQVASMATFLVYERPGFPAGTPPPAVPATIRLICGAPLEISSSEIRRKIREKKNVSELVPPGVLPYIQAHGLYQ